MAYLLVLAVGLAAGTISGIIGTGASIILVPVLGFLTGIVVSTGPLSVPAFTSYGLVKGGFIATEAASSLAVYVSKVVTFREMGALPLDAIVKGLITGSSLMIGAFVAKRIVLRLSPEFYRLLLDGLLLCSGLALLWAASR